MKLLKKAIAATQALWALSMPLHVASAELIDEDLPNEYQIAVHRIKQKFTMKRSLERTAYAENIQVRPFKLELRCNSIFSDASRPFRRHCSSF